MIQLYHSHCPHQQPLGELSLMGDSDLVCLLQGLVVIVELWHTLARCPFFLHLWQTTTLNQQLAAA